ncbi:FMN reductase [Antrihabitans cavernicola]|uniref:NADPH-dependent FMN reductase n=1 Tax=Antrihabitans cavernicola TaxID=2495913 RepID=A0A5A7S3Z0_9NOCA|nr:FMN reductase [Spelaeibacter cavernicola]KAA0020109.1 NADPH-dependent FMN reductase [Spelaeibacter cavernicola]
MTTLRIAVVTAGLSQPSSTRLLGERLATATEKALQANGSTARLEFVDLREHAQDLANNLITGFPAGSLRAAIEKVTGADALIAVTPIFNASYSGLFKTFFDVLEKDSLAGIPVLIGATGGSARHSLALEHALRPMFAYLHASVVPTSVYAATEDWGSSGAGGPGLVDRIDRAATELADILDRRPAVRPVDPFDDPIPFAQLLADQRA